MICDNLVPNGSGSADLYHLLKDPAFFVIRFFLLFCLMMEGSVQIMADLDPGGPKTDGSGSTTLTACIFSIYYCSVADPDPGSGAFLTPGSGIRNRFFSDPGSQTHIFESLLTIFWVKSSIIL